jgi:hypothetical protein
MVFQKIRVQVLILRLKIAIDAVDTGGNHLMMCNSSDLSDATVHSILNDVEIALKNREVKS